MKSKVIPETTVLIAAAIRIYVATLKTEVKHKFYDQCMNLFRLLKDKPETGIRTSRIVREARNALVGAFEETLLDEIGDRVVAFRGYSINLGRCQQSMRELISSLTEEAIVEDDEWYATLLEVARMYQGLLDMYVPPHKMRIEAGKRSWPSPFKGRLTRLVWHIRMDELRKRNEMIKRLRDKYPSDRDMEILTDTVQIQRRYATLAQVFLASCDTGAFSPTRLKGGIEMKLVTDEIRRRFGIICDWPNQIRQTLIQQERTH